MAAQRFIGLLTALSLLAGTAALRAEENIVKTARDSARELEEAAIKLVVACLLYTSPSPRDRQKSRMPSSA